MTYKQGNEVDQKGRQAFKISARLKNANPADPSTLVGYSDTEESARKIAQILKDQLSLHVQVDAIPDGVPVGATICGVRVKKDAVAPGGVEVRLIEPLPHRDTIEDVEDQSVIIKRNSEYVGLVVWYDVPGHDVLGEWSQNLPEVYRGADVSKALDQMRSALSQGKQSEKPRLPVPPGMRAEVAREPLVEVQVRPKDLTWEGQVVEILVRTNDFGLWKEATLQEGHQILDHNPVRPGEEVWIRAGQPSNWEDGMGRLGRKAPA